MVISKRTGKGCAWSIASKTITKKLIAEGIIDKPISRKPHKSRDDLLRVEKYRDGQVYVILQKADKLAEEPIWVPSFIDAVAWARGVNRFRAREKLSRNVEKYLLPEIGEYLQSIPESELVSMTRDFLIAQGVINSPICQRSGSTYYFNENEVYSLDANSDLFSYESRVKFNIFRIDYETCFNMTVWHKAVSQFEVGATLRECIQIFFKTELRYGAPKDQSPIDRLVQFITPPIFERVPGNNDEATFDYIRMTVGLPRYKFDSWGALQGEVEKYQREIYQQVIQKLKNDRQFKRYGVPINLLKMSSVMLLRDFSIEFIFELHEQKRHPPLDMGN